MKAKRPSKQSKKLTPKQARKDRRASEQDETCGYKTNWSLLESTAGYVAVWVPRKQYDKVAAAFLKKGAKDTYQKSLLRQRMALRRLVPRGPDLRWRLLKGLCLPM